MRPAGLVVAAVALVFGVAASSSAQPAEASIEAARERWFEAEFEASAAAFEAVLVRPDLSPADALEAHRYLAALAQLLGDEPSARAHADAAVALDSAAGPPEGAQPQARDLFLMARRRLAGREATIRVEAPAPLALGTEGRIVASVEPAPPSLFARLRLRCGDRRRDGAPPSVDLTIIPTGDLSCTAEALSLGGAVLRSSHRDFEVARPSRRAWPWALAGTIVGAAAIGVTVAVLVTRDGGEPNVVGTTVVGW